MWRETVTKTRYTNVQNNIYVTLLKVFGVYQMFTKIFILAIMFIILVSLFSGLIYLVRDKGQSKRTVKALTWRIGLSLSLFIFLVIAYAFHWINPHGL